MKTILLNGARNKIQSLKVKKPDEFVRLFFYKKTMFQN